MITSRAALAGSSVTILAVLALGACSTPAPAPADPSATDRPSGEITVYNAQHESMTQAWVDAFTAETGIRVTMRQGKDTEMSNQIIQEGSASPADVFITENSPAMAQVENAGLLAGLDQDVIDQVPAEYRPSSNEWTGVAARSTVFVYNPKLLSKKDLPQSLLDLADPEWKGKWGASPSGADFQAIVSAVLSKNETILALAEGDEGERHGLPGEWRGTQGRQRRRDRRRCDLPLLLLRRPGEDR